MGLLEEGALHLGEVLCDWLEKEARNCSIGLRLRKHIPLCNMAARLFSRHQGINVIPAALMTQSHAPQQRF